MHTEIDETTELFAENTAALDRLQLQRLSDSLVTMMARHGRGKILGICVEALKRAEEGGAKW